MKTHIGLLTVALFLSGAHIPVLADDRPSASTQITSKRTLTPEEQAQKAARRACKIEICGILATKGEQGPDVACDIGWTWREDEIIDVLGDRIDWPWGKLVCQSQIRLSRAALAEAMSGPRYQAAADVQTVRCSLHNKDGKPYIVEIELAPRVTFENGKATEAQVNWGDVSAPAAIYPLLYAATGLDNSTNVLGPEVAHQINKFARKDCAKVKSELPGAAPD
ncbi:MAG: hypothetical protein ACRECX_04180 [Methyloceanibacter sp.]|uniref:hypothetical protein n=1 Tax=Methyloceanibacter sp. TaxID=1965321 RepID=UPI003D6CC134